MLELIIHFNTPTEFSIRYDDDETENLAFESPITDDDYQDIRWYLETYSTAYTAEPDQARATRIAEQLPRWGEALLRRLLFVISRPQGAGFIDPRQEAQALSHSDEKHGQMGRCTSVVL